MAARAASLSGILGGTFDPIHYAHLRVAEEITDALGLREMRFIPAGAPRLRDPPVASPQQRAAMVSAAIRGNPRFVLDEREVTRPGASYSVQTLRELRQELDAQTALCFVVGADVFPRLAEWHRWHELFELCHLVIATRPGHAFDDTALPPALRQEYRQRLAGGSGDLRDVAGGLILVVQTSLLEISATAIRASIAAGGSARYLLPDAVLDYIAANHLYAGAE